MDHVPNVRRHVAWIRHVGLLNVEMDIAHGGKLEYAALNLSKHQTFIPAEKVSSIDIAYVTSGLWFYTIFMMISYCSI